MKKWITFALAVVPVALAMQTVSPATASAVQCTDCPVLDTGGGWSDGTPGGGPAHGSSCYPIGPCVNGKQTLQCFIFQIQGPCGDAG